MVTAAFLELTGGRSEVRWGAMKAPHWTRTAGRLIHRGRAAAGWAPRHDLRQGLAKMAAPGCIDRRRLMALPRSQKAA